MSRLRRRLLITTAFLLPHTNSGIYWEEHGQGPLTLVILPGFGASAELMAGIVRHLSGFRILVFDLPGHGRSVRAPADGRLPTLAATLHDAIKEAIRDAGVDAYYLAGCSLGGAIALRLALDHHTRRQRRRCRSGQTA
jgi:pimeloyl-ACP methyl ester carboxylesterase